MQTLRNASELFVNAAVLRNEKKKKSEDIKNPVLATIEPTSGENRRIKLVPRPSIKHSSRPLKFIWLQRNGRKNFLLKYTRSTFTLSCDKNALTIERRIRREKKYRRSSEDDVATQLLTGGAKNFAFLHLISDELYRCRWNTVLCIRVECTRQDSCEWEGDVEVENPMVDGVTRLGIYVALQKLITFLERNARCGERDGYLSHLANPRGDYVKDVFLGGWRSADDGDVLVRVFSANVTTKWRFLMTLRSV